MWTGTCACSFRTHASVTGTTHACTPPAMIIAACTLSTMLSATLQPAAQPHTCVSQHMLNLHIWSTCLLLTNKHKLTPLPSSYSFNRTKGMESVTVSWCLACTCRPLRASELSDANCAPTLVLWVCMLSEPPTPVDSSAFCIVGWHVLACLLWMAASNSQSFLVLLCVLG